MSPLPTIAALEAMERAELLAAWTAIFGGPAPRSISQPLLRRFLAIEIQARRSGGLTAKFHAGLDRAARQETRVAARPPQPGGRLLREWNGVTHVVEVTGDGYHWNGAVYRSLSAIAREITGAHWSGPRFFGLKGATAS